MFTLFDIIVSAISFALSFLLYFRTRESKSKGLRGPPASSFLLGVEYDLRKSEAGDTLRRWKDEYGTAYETKSCFGETFLVVSDPQALHHIFHEVDTYSKLREARMMIGIMFGRGILWAEGEDHKRHRKVLSPAFSLVYLKKLSPLFQKHGIHLCDMWKDALRGQTSAVINVVPWLQKTALDVIGESAFNCHFGSLKDIADIPTQDAHKSRERVMRWTPSLTVLSALARHIPDFVISFQTKYFPMSLEKSAKRVVQMARMRARELMKTVESSIDVSNDGHNDEKDVLSVLIKANMAEDPKTQLSEEETLAEMTSLIQAGHDTIAQTLSWALYELAAHPQDQAQVYEEIQHVRTRTGASELTSADLGSMNHLNLVLKEVIRLHPVVPVLFREARNDDVLHLDFSVVARDGSMINTVPVKKGQIIRADISSYNRLKAVWGEDAEEWNPNRFDSENQGTKQGRTIGFFANTLTFSAGPKGCIGWRFAVMELQALLITLLEQFEFILSPNVEIEDLLSFIGTSVPLVKGAEDKGSQLPLRVIPRLEG